VRDFLKAYKYKSVIITPGVDTDRFSPPKSHGRNAVLYVGSVRAGDTHKGLRYLLEAFAQVAIQFSEAELVVVGGGDGQAVYGAMARSLGIASRVKFLGALEGDKLVAEYQRAAILVVPSLSESFGMVAAEAMAAGLPVVATKVGGLPSLVADKQTGYLVPPANAQALAKKISYLLTHPKIAEKFGAAGRRRAEARLDWQIRARQTNELLLACYGAPTGESHEQVGKA
jgi:glycosyltransferase involved in cell wall biosynthesis